MRLCWHDWKVWSTIKNKNKGIATGLTCAVLGLIAFILVCNAGLTSVTTIFWSAALTISICFYGIVSTGMSADGYSDFKHENKTCLKCGKNVFDLTVQMEKQKRAEEAANARTELAEAVSLDFKRDLELFKKARG